MKERARKREKERERERERDHEVNEYPPAEVAPQQVDEAEYRLCFQARGQRVWYRLTSLTRNSPPPLDHRRALGIVLLQYGVWCMVYGVWCMVYGIWYAMYGM